MSTQPKHIRAFELRLESNWSSENVEQMLTPDFVGTVLLQGFAALEPSIKMRALIAFLGVRAQQLAPLRHQLPALLRIADNDKDEWVQVVSGLVRRKLLPSEVDASSATFGVDSTATPTTHLIYSSTVLCKTVTEVLERAQQIMSERSSSGEPATPAGSGEIRFAWQAPYFGPLEERYVSRKQQPLRKEFANAHFSPKHDVLKELSEDLASNVGTSNTSSSPTGAGAAAAAAALGFRQGQGGLLKPPGGSSAPLPAPVGPNLAQARRVSLAATDPAAGSDGLRRTSKPFALARNHVGLHPGAGGPHFGGRKSGAGAGGTRGVRGGGGGGSGVKAGLLMINVDELQAIHAEKQSAKEKAKGKPGRKKAKIEQKAADTEPSSGAVAAIGQPISHGTADGGSADRRSQEELSGEGKAAEAKAPAKPAAPPDGPMPVPQQGEIEAMAAMMVLGAAGGGGEAAETSYLPEPLTKLLENANSLRPEGKAKLESFFQKKTPEGSPQERVKYHEEVNPGADGDLMRVTSYIRLDYETWVWDRVHKKKRVKS